MQRSAGLSTNRSVEKSPSCDKGGRATIEAQLQEITRDLLRELGNTSAIEGVRGRARLDEDLGLESIERAELMSRMNRVLGTSLPESAIAEARTLDDIVTAIAGSPGTEAGSAADLAAAEPLRGTERNSAATASAAGQAVSSSAGLIGTALDTLYGIYAAGVFIVWLVLAWLSVEAYAAWPARGANDFRRAAHLLQAHRAPHRSG